MDNSETPVPEITTPPVMQHFFLCSAELEYIEGKHNKATRTRKLDTIYRHNSSELNVKCLEKIQQAFQMKFYKERVQSPTPCQITDVTLLAISHIFFGTEETFLEGSLSDPKRTPKPKSVPSETKATH